MSEGEGRLTTSLVVSRLGTLFAIVVLVGYVLWDMFSETTALSRLSATASIFHYTQRCDADGNLIASGSPNCVDLNHYMFVHGSIDKAFRRTCAGKTAEMLTFEKGIVGTFEINLVQKMLASRSRGEPSPPC